MDLAKLLTFGENGELIPKLPPIFVVNILEIRAGERAVLAVDLCVTVGSKLSQSGFPFGSRIVCVLYVVMLMIVMSLSYDLRYMLHKPSIRDVFYFLGGSH